jgi:hypothetical protein
MADEPEDVLELDEALEIEGEEQGEEGQGEAEAAGDDEEDLIGFGDEGAAPAPEDATSTVRHLREELRRQQRENAELRKVTAKPKVELGARPTLADVDYDEDRFEAALDDWKSRKAQIEREEQESQEQARKGAQEWADRTEAYKARKAQLRVPDFDVAEATVFTALPEAHQALLMKSGKAAELVAALHRSPAKLDELSKLDLTDAAMLVGELRSKLTVNKRKPSPNLDQPLRGNAAVSGGGDRELARLEKEADRTGDSSALIAYRHKLKSQAR